MIQNVAMTVAVFAAVLSLTATTCVDAMNPHNGFYRLQNDDGDRWWVVDSRGCSVVLRGVDHVNWNGPWCEELRTNPYNDVMKKKFSSCNEWADETLSRLKAWGFNTLGSCSTDLERKGLAHCRHLVVGELFCRQGRECALGAAEGIPGTAFPNVFHPDFEKFCDERAARECAPNKEDRSLLGYFFDNELAWNVRGSSATGLYEAAARLSADDSMRKALDAFLSERNIVVAEASVVSDETKVDFLRLVASRYFGTIAAAIRRHDPNHLLLGCRFAGVDSAHRVVWEEAGKVCDIVSFNDYPWADIDHEVVYTSCSSGLTVADVYAERHVWAKKPLMVTEWSFPALDSGLPCTSGAGQRFYTQTERTKAAVLFVRTVLSLPFIVGYDYFMWVDQPALGVSRKFPEDSNYGLVNGRGEPYKEITAMFTRIHRDAEVLHMRGEVLVAKSVARTGIAKRFDDVAKGCCHISFVRDGENYTLASPSGLVLSGRVGGSHAFDAVRFGGIDYGKFTFMVYHGQWQDIERVESVEWLDERGTLRVAGVLRCDEKAFRVICDIVPFADKPWFGCDIVSLENIGASAVYSVSLYLRQYAPWADDKTNLKKVPNLWKATGADVWIRAADGAWCGAATTASNVAILYWVSPDGCAHPDAKFTLPSSLRLASGAVWKPDGTAWMIAAVGMGGEDGWRTFRQQVQCK